MEMISGRGQVRSGRAVVGLDVVSHTLPRSFRTPTTQPCCPPTTHPELPEDICSDPGCAGCQPDLCAGDPDLQFTGGSPFPAHIYPSVLTSGWGAGGEDDCLSCSLSSQPPCVCPDPRCSGSQVTPSPFWGHHEHHEHRQQQQQQTQSAETDVQVTRTASECTLPKLLSIEEQLTTALGRPPDAQVQTRSHNRKMPPASHRLSRSVEDLPKDIKEHILKCQCSCDHLGYGNFSNTKDPAIKRAIQSDSWNF
ncbi:uncharacterized protein [Penaeus vannamei]|uniref:uncharacterized protein n=1 Tax=Penaeus vannamei TaxID=6689 RepID=UPI00387F4145